MNSRQYAKLAHVARKLGISFPKREELQSGRQQEKIGAPIQLPSQWKALKKVGGAALACVALLATLFQFWPDVSVEPYASRDQHSPFAQLFSVENTNYYSIYDVQPLCLIEKASDISRNSYKGIQTEDTSQSVAILERRAKTTATCNIGGNATFSNIVISIPVLYHIPLGITRCKAVRFEGVITTSRDYLWAYKGSGACPDSVYRK
ncbi:MAG TPA: hypothetical protein VNX18_07510 [Bryobacteraceae bacterium]|jgi:hypothetical protein|nr:hypothetical protein [Bryobacteraceae bacterium]